MAYRWKNTLRDRDVTDETVYLNRRQLLAGVAAGVGLAGIGGQAVSQVFEGQRRFDIVVRYPEDIRTNFRDVMNVPVQLPGGDYIPLERVATIIVSKNGAELGRISPKAAEETGMLRPNFQAMLKKLELKQPANGTAMDIDEALSIAETIGYPVIVRPSFVLGGRAMMVAYDATEARPFIRAALDASPGFPVLIDRYLERAIEVDSELAVVAPVTVSIKGVMTFSDMA